MANSKLALDVKFDTNTEMRRPLDPGTLEPDDFYINDIALRIPATGIHVSKESFNSKYDTLRTESSRKAKSGHGTVRVAFSVVFKISDSLDRDNLSRVVAGLRATPFCVVHNQYLENMVGRPDDETPVANGNPSRKTFQPIMLALLSMSFTTMGHERKPDCIRAQFDFLWFNYLPYTNQVAFKSGIQLNRPGHPWESAVWQAFYEPFYYNQFQPNFPHPEEDVAGGRTTSFMWREFLSIPRGTPGAVAATKDLVEALRKRPKEVLKILSGIISQGVVTSEWERADIKNPEAITSGVLDTLFHRAVKQGLISPSEEVRKQIENMPKGSITKAGSSVLFPVIRKIYGKNKLSTGDLDSIDVAAVLISEKLKKIKSIKERGDVSFSTISGDKYQQILSTDAKFGGKNSQLFAGGLDLFGRKKRYEIVHNNNPGNSEDSAVIQQIVVTFKNTLSTIPMLAYRYPTVQHIGSIDAEVNFVINAHNTAAKDIRTMYDSVETMALRYREIPAGFMNLNIRNDFLGLFGLEEFLTQRLEIEPISGMPGRSQVILTVEDAGITSKTKDPEAFNQEFIQGDFEIFKGIWKVVEKDTARQGGLSGASTIGFSGFFSSTRDDIQKPTEYEFYRKKISGVSLDGNSAAYLDSLEKAVSYFNDFLKNVHSEVFSSDTVSGEVNFAAIMTLKEDDSFFGYIPGISWIQQSLKDRNSAYSKASKRSKMRSAVFQENKRLKLQAKANKIISRLTGNARITENRQIQANSNRLKRLSRMGITHFLSNMNSLFNKIIQEQLPLKQFQHLLKEKEKRGLYKGLIAYPDFRDQLSGVAKLAENARTKNDSVLMKYNPDCYFYYPLYNGASNSPLLGIIDPYYITAAKFHSNKIVENAEESINNFFQGTYQSRLKNDQHSGPYDVLMKDYGGSKLQPFLYQDGNIKNSTQGESIKKSVIPDPHAKSPTNWYPEKLPTIKSNQICEHTTSITQLWGGVNASPNASSRDKSNQGAKGLGPLNTSRSRGGINPSSSSIPGKTMLKRAQNVAQFAVDSAKRYNIDPSLVLSIIQTESGFKNLKPNGAGSIPGTSTKCKKGQCGATGLMQLMTQYYGKFGDIQNDSALNIQLGTKSISKYIQKYRDVEIALSAYNMGPGNINKWRKAHKKTISGEKLNDTDRAIYRRFGIAASPTGKTPKWQWDRYQGKILKRQTFWAGKLREWKLVPNSAARWTPPGPIQKRLDQEKTNPLSRDVLTTITSPLGESISAFERDLYNGQAQSMMRAYPAFKLYFIEDDSTEKRFAFDDFFSYQAVQSIRVIDSREIAASLCEIYLTNVSGILSNRKFRESKKNDQPMGHDGKVAKEPASAMKAGTRQENPIASLMLQEGINISLRMGYSTDPDMLSTVFNGSIVDVQFSESDDLVKIVAQSYAKELLQDIKGIEKPETKSSWESAFGWDFWGFSGDATTGRILEEVIAEPEVLHFGRWNPATGGSNPSRDLLTQRWTFEPQPADDNIFAPNPKQDIGLLEDGIFFKNLKYIIYRTTIWDIFQEMTLRHPNFIAAPVPYKGKNGERMTMFFGLPNQLYFARDPNAEEQIASEKLKQIGESTVSSVMNSAAKQIEKKSILGDAFKAMSKIGAALSPVSSSAANLASRYALSRAIQASPVGQVVNNVVTNFYRNKRFREAKKAEYIKPFRSYHLITSSQHLISNNIRASSKDIANTIVIKYGTSVEVEDQLKNIAMKTEEEEFTLKLDNALPTDEIRTQMGQFINVTNANLAKRYALGLLCRNLRKIYKGEIVMVGNPRVKPHDVCYLFDEYTDMVGAFEVEEVQHIFDQQHGFRTEIKPNMLVQASEISLLGSAEAIGVAVEGAIRKMGLHNNSLLKFFSPTPFVMGHGIDTFGGFLSQKIINYTQLAQPIIMSPLIHRGRMFTGGVPTRKIPTSSWSTAFGNWSPTADHGYEDWAEDVSDKMLGWIKKATGQFSTGNLFNNGGDSPE